MVDVNHLRFSFLLVAIAAAGCPGFGDSTLADLAPPTAEPPTWDNAIKPLLEAKCGYCHTDPMANFAPPGFRLDRFDRMDADGTLDGAFEKRARIMDRAVSATSMPPSNAMNGPLSDVERAALGEWIMSGAPRGAAASQ